MERRMDELLGGLKRQLIRMSALAESMIADALKLLVSRDASLAPTIQKQEQEVNLLQVEIDETCLNIIALHQPTAGDLRFILGAAKTNSDLERLADQAVNICQKGEHLIQQPPFTMVATIPRMGTLAAQMVKDALHAYVTRDPLRARAVLTRDDELDEMKRRVTDALLEIMRTDSSQVARCLDLVLIASSLERIGDHATNIAENAIFVVEGRDVRHHHDEKPAHHLA